MRRGCVVPYKYLSDKTQKAMLIAADVSEKRALYGGLEWGEFIRNLRPGDEAVVAELRVFGSRKSLTQAIEEVESRGAVLVAANPGIPIDSPTLKETYETERKWAGQRSIGGSRRARHLSAMGNAARKAKALAERMPEAAAKAIWRDIENYPTRIDALEAMPGWSKMIAWRAFGPREG